MSKLLRKLRGLAGFGITWGTLWGIIGGGIGAVIAIVSPGPFGWWTPILEWALGMGLYGFVSGVGFGALLSFREGRRTLHELSLRRVAIWGVLGAAGVPILFGLAGTFEFGTTLGEVVGAVLVTSGLGGIFAPGTVAIARQAELSAVPEQQRLE